MTNPEHTYTKVICEQNPAPPRSMADLEDPIRRVICELSPALLSLTAAPEDTGRKVIRELIMHENELFHQRRTFFAVLQGLLWTAAGLVMQSKFKAKDHLIYIIAGLGGVLALVLGYSMEISLVAVNKLKNRAAADFPGTTPVIGFDVSADNSDVVKGLGEKLTVRFHNWNPAKYLFTAAWIAFAVVVKLK